MFISVPTTTVPTTVLSTTESKFVVVCLLFNMFNKFECLFQCQRQTFRLLLGLPRKVSICSLFCCFASLILENICNNVNDKRRNFCGPTIKRKYVRGLLLFNMFNATKYLFQCQRQNFRLLFCLLLKVSLLVYFFFVKQA